MLNEFSASISKPLLGIALAMAITVTIVTANTQPESFRCCREDTAGID